MSSPGWYPPQWGQGTTSTVTLAVPNPNGTTPPANTQGNLGDGLPFQGSASSTGVAAPPTIYVFDAVIRAENQQELVITLNPVQTGASLTDHAYTLPARLVLDVAMSDSMQSFTTGQWSSSPSRSVSAYQTLLAIQASLALLQVSTRLNQYSNMLITDIRAEETDKTRYALKATVTLQQILIATVQNSPGIPYYLQPNSSARPQTTNANTAGPTQATPVPTAIGNQNAIINAPSNVDLAAEANVLNAGTYSSNNTSSLSQVLNFTP